MNLSIPFPIITNSLTFPTLQNRLSPQIYFIHPSPRQLWNEDRYTITCSKFKCYVVLSFPRKTGCKFSFLDTLCIHRVKGDIRCVPPPHPSPWPCPFSLFGNFELFKLLAACFWAMKTAVQFLLQCETQPQSSLSKTHIFFYIQKESCIKLCIVVTKMYSCSFQVQIVFSSIHFKLCVSKLLKQMYFHTQP